MSVWLMLTFIGIAWPALRGALRSTGTGSADIESLSRAN